MNAANEEITIEQTTYTLRTRLGWLEQARIDQAGLQLFADGKTISDGKDLEEMPEVEMRFDAAEKNYKRLCARLLDMKAAEVKRIDPRHVPILIKRIEQLEAEESAEIKSLADEYPLT